MIEAANQASKRYQVSSWPFVVAIVALLLALPRGWPHGYYDLLRFLVCGVAVYGIFQGFRQRRIVWIGLLLGMTILFNPIVTIHFPKSAWILLNLSAAGLLGLFSIELKLGPNNAKAPFYRRLANWLDESRSTPDEIGETRYERLTGRTANIIGLALLIVIFGSAAYELFSIWEDVPWWVWLAFLASVILWIRYQVDSRE